MTDIVTVRGEAVYIDVGDRRPWYQRLVEAIAYHASDTDQWRIQACAGSPTEGRDELERGRMMLAAHLATGHSLLRIVGTDAPKTNIPGDTVSLMLDWRRYITNPGGRYQIVQDIARSPVPALLRATLLDVARLGKDVHDGMHGRQLGTCLISAATQIARAGTAGAEDMIQLALACRFPPMHKIGG